MAKEDFLKKDYSYNRYKNYKHVYCKNCGHSCYFISNHNAICSYCGMIVYSSEKNEFKSKLEKELKKNKYKEKL